MSNKLIAIGITLLMVSACLVLVPDNADAGLFTDLNSPDATLRDIAWEENGDYALVVGNDSGGNGVTYRYQENDESWTPLTSVPGDSYNAVAHAEPFVYSEDIEGDVSGWQTNSWSESSTSDSNPLVAEWKFDEDSGSIAHDTSGSSLDGTMYNIDDTYWVDGVDKNCMKFTGSEYMRMDEANGLTSGSFSGSCWINMSAHLNYGGIVNTYQSSQGGWGIWTQTDGTIKFYRHDGVSMSSDVTTFPLNTNEWHHLAWVYNDTTGNAYFYVNGELDWSMPSVKPKQTMDYLYIGYYSVDNFEGFIDDVKIYDTALNPNEVSEQYNLTAYKKGEWNFDEGFGNIANDTGPNDYDGALTYAAVDTPTWTYAGVSGDALYFDGNDNVTTDYLPDTFNQHDHSIDAWVKPTFNSSAGVIYAIGELGNNGKSFEFKIANGMIQIWHWGWNWNTGVYIDMNKWTHITYTYDADIKTGYLYVNGIDKGSYEYLGYLNILNDNNIPSQIGHGFSGNYFEGFIDEVTIYNYTVPQSAVMKNHLDVLSNYMRNETRAGEWKLDEGSGLSANDAGIHNNDGTLVNMDNADWVEGITGYGLYFDGLNGGNRVELPIVPEVQPANTLSLAAWVKLNETVDEPIISGGGISYGLGIQGGKAVFQANLGALTTLSSIQDIAPGVWYYLAATYDGSTMRLYINGSLDHFIPASGSIDYAGFSNGLTLGYYYGSSAVMHGVLDNPQIWNRAVSALSISNSYISILEPKWHISEPTALPTPGSGTSHGTANSGSKIAWYGIENTGNYDNGLRTMGSLVSPVTYLPNSNFGLVVFNHWFEVEQTGPGVDIMTVSIKNTTDPGWTILKTWDSGSIPITSWSQEAINIDGWIGNNIQVNFTFDSVDGSLNDYAGWHIDDFTLYTSGQYIVVGDMPSGAGSSVYAMDMGGTSTEMTGMRAVDYNDVAAGSLGHTFMAVGDSGAAEYWNGSAWFSLTGVAPTDTLTSIDSSSSHFYIVGYDSIGEGVAYYITQIELNNSLYALHEIRGAPATKLNSIEWNDYAPMGNGKNGLGLVGGEGAVFGLEDPEIWSRENPTSAPSARNQHAMVYDTFNQKYIMFGGTDNGGYNGETWVYDSSSETWTNMNPVSSPGARYSHEMVFDSSNNVVVLFGGYDSGGRDGETWTYDYSSNTWTNMNPAIHPTGRNLHAMAFDSNNNKVILFGGYDTAANGETWEYDYPSNTWTNRNPAVPPTARYNHEIVYDSANDKVILFGGYDAGYISETWAYDYTSNTWTNMNPATPPTGRRTTMSYDEAQRVAMLFGGYTGLYQGDTWTYDYSSNTWTNLNPAFRPLKMNQHAMAYDPSEREFILFGGYDGTRHNGTWVCQLDAPWGEAGGDSSNVNYTGAGWSPDNDRAIIVGNDAAGAVVCEYYTGNSYITQIPDKQNRFADHKLFSASYQPTEGNNSQVMLVGASAFKIKPSEVDQLTTITANAVFPKLYWIGFNETDGTDRLDQQVPTDDWYDFTLVANYTQGWANCEVIVQAWYDNGAVGAGSAYPAETDANRNLAFQLTYTAAGACVVDYPTGSLEVDTAAVADNVFWAHPTDAGQDHHYLEIPVYLGAQIRNASAGGFGSGDADYDGLPNNALLDANSWDFNITVRDRFNTAAKNTSYGEFGIDKAVSISVSGNPAGNAPPGSGIQALSNPSLISYSANSDYWVNVSIPHLYENGLITSPDWIDASDVYAWNVQSNTTFANTDFFGAYSSMTLPNTDMYVWAGNTGANTPMAAPRNGTNATGPVVTNYNAPIWSENDYTQLNWAVDVQASTPEGVYWAVITISIDN